MFPSLLFHNSSWMFERNYEHNTITYAPVLMPGTTYDVAHNLAEKIIDYERKLSYLQEIYQNEIISPYAPDHSRGAAFLQPGERQEELVDILRDIEQQALEVKNQEKLHVQDRKLLRS